MTDMTPATARTLISNLEYMVKSYSESLQAAEHDVRGAEKRRAEWAKRLENAKALLDFERDRLGKQLSLDDASPYAGLGLRRAALQVIEGRAGEPITSGNIIDTLRSHGYAFDTRYPGRALHAALIGVRDVEKVAGGTYRWRRGHASRNDAGGAAP